MRTTWKMKERERWDGGRERKIKRKGRERSEWLSPFEGLKRREV